MTQIIFRTTGNGPALLLLHAFPVTSAMWSSQLDALCDEANALAPDLPGFGASSEAAMPSTLDALALQIYEGSRERGIDRAVVAGCSMGGYLAFAMLRVAPQFVRALALINTKATADTEPARAKRLALAERAEREGCAFLVDEWPPGALSPATFAHNLAAVAGVRAMIEQATPQGVSAAQRAMAQRPDASALLAAISVPCIVVHGLDDPMISGADAQSMAAAITGARFIGIRAAGHLPSVEQPALVSAALRELLARTEQLQA